MSISRADQITLQTNLTGLTENVPTGKSVVLDTGDLRRRFNFGDRISELRISQDPFFRLLSKLGKKVTDDPEFKFVERRNSFHKRYIYVVQQGATEGALAADEDLGALAVDDDLWVQVATDYLTSGLIGSRRGQVTNKIDVGSSGTKPAFFVPGLMLKINTNDDVTSWDVNSYIIGRVVTVNSPGGDVVNLKLKITRDYSGSNSILTSFTAAGTAIVTTYDRGIATGAEPLEAARSYITGSAWGRGTDYPTTWIDQPFSTDYGYTQIFKTSLIMDRTTQATLLKYEGNEWMRNWTEKLIQHKWDVETSFIFGSLHKGDDNVYYSEGAVNYALTYGNVFQLDIASKMHDEFLDDMSEYIDPRYNNDRSIVFYVQTKVWNWLHKLGGYYANNVGIDSQFRGNMTIKAKGSYKGVNMSRIELGTGETMNIVKNIHLDGSPVKMLGINHANAKIRPLVGNGINRDTHVRVLPETGTDADVSYILTECGLEMSVPEGHSVWL